MGSAATTATPSFGDKRKPGSGKVYPIVRMSLVGG